MLNGIVSVSIENAPIYVPAKTHFRCCVVNNICEPNPYTSLAGKNCVIKIGYWLYTSQSAA